MCPYKGKNKGNNANIWTLIYIYNLLNYQHFETKVHLLIFGKKMNIMTDLYLMFILLHWPDCPLKNTRGVSTSCGMAEWWMQQIMNLNDRWDTIKDKLLCPWVRNFTLTAWYLFIPG
jgi:hypothetical protein